MLVNSAADIAVGALEETTSPHRVTLLRFLVVAGRPEETYQQFKCLFPRFRCAARCAGHALSLAALTSPAH